MDHFRNGTIQNVHYLSYFHDDTTRHDHMPQILHLISGKKSTRISSQIADAAATLGKLAEGVADETQDLDCTQVYHQKNQDTSM